MNEKLQTALADAINKAITGVQQGGEFVLDQAPEVVQQFLRWKFYENMGDGFLWLVAAIVLLGLLVKWHRHSRNFDIDVEGPYFFVHGILGLPALFAAVAAYQNFLYCLQIYVAPKVYLIEWAASQVSK